jgi:hypothetical protein
VWNAAKRLLGWFRGDAAKIVLGWFLGIITLVVGQDLTTSDEIRKLARLLVVEVKANQVYLRAYAALGEQVEPDGRVRDASGTVLPFTIDQTTWLKPSYLRTTVFTATLSDHGLLQEQTLAALHKFYSDLGQVQRFSDAAEDRTNSREQRVGFSRDAGQTARAGLQRLEQSGLIESLEREARCGIMCRLWRRSEQPGR